MSQAARATHTRPIDRANPACIVVMVDQSASMAKAFGRQKEKRKSEGVADSINRLLHALCLKCGRADGIREFFRVGVIGYGRGVKSAMGGKLANRGLVKIGEIAANPLELETRTKLVDDGAGGVLKQNVRFPVWFRPVADGKTPMKEAFELAHRWVAEFLSEHPDSYPPLVMNITDGAADSDPSSAAAALRKLESSDGNVVLFNAHISEKADDPILFPEKEDALPGDFAKQLFRMSSVLPATLITMAREEEFDVGPTSRGFVFNADLVTVIRFLNIGTQLKTQSATGAAER